MYSIAVSNSFTTQGRSTLAKVCEIAGELQEHLSSVTQVLQLDTGTSEDKASTQMDLYSGQSDFEYKSLDRSEIRLLQLLRSPSGEIKCKLVHNALHSEMCPRYEALSYTWGNLELVETIRVDDKTLRVTDNLHTALCHLQSADRDRMLWIDAICIDQKNDQERSQQVENMGEIFRRAEGVLIWLGKATAEIDRLMHCLPQIEEQGVGYTAAAQVAKEALREGLRTLLRRPWFDRVWVLQEVANARSAIVCVGKRCIPAHLLAHAPHTLQINADSHHSSVLGLMLSKSSPGSEQHPRQALDALLFRFQSSKASDERDKVYALRAMSSRDEDAEHITPDYSTPTPIVIQHTVHYLFVKKRHSADKISDFLASFYTLTTVCVVYNPRRDSYYASDDPTTNAKLRGLLESCYYQGESNRRTALWHIEQESSPDEGATCYSQLSQMMTMQAFVLADERIRTLTWSTIKQNMIVVFIPGGLEALLRIASSEGYSEVVKMLVEKGADVNAEELIYGTVLQAASYGGHSEVVKILLEGGADVNARGHRFLNALQAASYKGHLEVVKMLLERGADVNAHEGDFGNALQKALSRGHSEVVNILRAKGARG